MFPPNQRFFDIGALVWFSHIIEWEFPSDFSVDRCKKNSLLHAQQILEQNGCVEGRIHRFFISRTQNLIERKH